MGLNESAGLSKRGMKPLSTSRAGEQVLLMYARIARIQISSCWIVDGNT